MSVVRSRTQKTIMDINDVVQILTWYQLASSSVAPSPPTFKWYGNVQPNKGMVANDYWYNTTDDSLYIYSGGSWSKDTSAVLLWTLTEPSYTTGSTSSLYTIQQSVFGDESCVWGSVSLASSYEAAKDAIDAADDAAKVATNYLTFAQGAGLDVGYNGTLAKTRITGSGVEIYDANGASAASFGTSARIGTSSGSNVQIGSTGFRIYDNNSSILAEIDTSVANPKTWEDQSLRSTTLPQSTPVGTTLSCSLITFDPVLQNSNITFTIRLSSRMVDPIEVDTAFVCGVPVSSEVVDWGVQEDVPTTIDYDGEKSFVVTFGSYVINLASQYPLDVAIIADYTTVTTYSKYAFGKDVTASGNFSFVEGSKNIAAAENSHAEGYSNKANGFASHAEGGNSQTLMQYSHAEGYGTAAWGKASHAEGNVTIATAENAHAEGSGSAARGKNSHAQNNATIAASDNQTAIGKFNVADDNGTYAFIIGNGTGATARKNALTVDWTGNIVTKGGLTAYDDVAIYGDVTVSGTVSGSNGEYAPLSSPDLTGTPTAPTATTGTNTTQIATTAFVQDAIDSSKVDDEFLTRTVTQQDNISISANGGHDVGFTAPSSTYTSNNIKYKLVSTTPLNVDVFSATTGGTGTTYVIATQTRPGGCYLRNVGPNTAKVRVDCYYLYVKMKNQS